MLSNNMLSIASLIMYSLSYPPPHPHTPSFNTQDMYGWHGMMKYFSISCNHLKTKGLGLVRQVGVLAPGLPVEAMEMEIIVVKIVQEV